MPKISAADGTRLYVEEIGAGTPVVFVHEYAGDYRSFEPQMRYFVPPAPLRHLQPARLSAVRRAVRSRALFAGRSRATT